MKYLIAILSIFVSLIFVNFLEPVAAVGLDGPALDRLMTLSRQFSGRRPSVLNHHLQNAENEEQIVDEEEAPVIPEPENKDDCAICLTSMLTDDAGEPIPEDSELIMKTKCDHRFHKDCIEPWFKKHRTCPLCRDLVRPPRRFAEIFQGGSLQKDLDSLKEQNEILKKKQAEAAKRKNNHEERLVIALEGFDQLQTIFDNLFRKYFDNPELSYRPEAFASRYTSFANEKERVSFEDAHAQLQKFWKTMEQFEREVSELRAYTAKTLELVRRHPDSLRRQAWIVRWRSWKKIGTSMKMSWMTLKSVLRGALSAMNINAYEDLVLGLDDIENGIDLVSTAADAEN